MWKFNKHQKPISNKYKFVQGFIYETLLVSLYSNSLHNSTIIGARSINPQVALEFIYLSDWFQYQFILTNSLI